MRASSRFDVLRYVQQMTRTTKLRSSVALCTELVAPPFLGVVPPTGLPLPTSAPPLAAGAGFFADASLAAIMSGSSVGCTPTVTVLIMVVVVLMTVLSSSRRWFRYSTSRWSGWYSSVLYLISDFSSASVWFVLVPGCIMACGQRRMNDICTGGDNQEDDRKKSHLERLDSGLDEY